MKLTRKGNMQSKNLLEVTVNNTLNMFKERGKQIFGLVTIQNSIVNLIVILKT